MRAHWLNALAATVNRFTGGTQIRHFVMAITPRMLATTSRTFKIPTHNRSYANANGWPRRGTHVGLYPDHKPVGSSLARSRDPLPYLGYPQKEDQELSCFRLSCASRRLVQVLPAAAPERIRQAVRD